MNIIKTPLKHLRFRRCLLFAPKSRTFLYLLILTLCGIILFEEALFYMTPYYLVDDPKYVFINNDNDYELALKARPACNPINSREENVRVLIDNVAYPQITPLNQNRQYNFTCLNSSHHRPLILLWNLFQGLPINELKEGPIESRYCPVTNCELTKDRRRLNESSYVLFHMRAPIDEFPKVRFSRQKWVYVIYESQQNCPMCTKLDGFFNLTATYRHDSDITSVYYGEAGLSWSNESAANFDQLAPDRFSLKPRLGFAAALISDCSDNVRRLDYIKEIKQYIPVDLYGKCSGVRCPFKGESCRQWLAGYYKFFFALENSVCDGYITEKLFATLRYDVIPVVLGGGTYTKYIPKSAFINVLDYPNPADLAAYLSYLASNQTAYSEYFEWKRFFRIDQPTSAPSNSYLCEMCIRLNLEYHSPMGLERLIFRNHSVTMGMKENCRGVKIKRNENGQKEFKYVKGQYLKMHFY